MKKTIVTVAACAFALSAFAPNAAFSFALQGSGEWPGIPGPAAKGNSANAPGQEIAREKCGGLGTEGFVPEDSVVEKQYEAGIVGSKNGNPNDKKQGNHAVTNCDHYWQFAEPRPASRH